MTRSDPSTAAETDRGPAGTTSPSLQRAGSAVLLSRILTLATGFISVAILPLVLSKEAVGTFFLVQIAVAGLALVVQFGLTYTIPAVVTTSLANSDVGRARQALRQIGMISITIGLTLALAALVVMLAARSTLDSLSPYFNQSVMLLVAVNVPLAAYSALLTEALRAVHAVRVAAMLSALPGCALVVGLFVLLVGRWPASIELVLGLVVAGHVMAFLIGAGFLLRVTRGWSSEPAEPITMQVIVREAVPNLATTIVLYGLSQFDMMLVSAFSTLSDVANYGVALRISALMIMPLSIANSAFVPIMVHLWASGDVTQLRTLLGKIALLSAGVAAAMWVAFALVGWPLFELWNADYRPAFWLALLLGAGQVAHALAGSSGVLLLVLGDQKAAFLITVVWGLVTLVACASAMALFGTIGLAAASACCNAGQVFLFALRLKWRFDLDATLFGLRRGNFSTANRRQKMVIDGE